MSTTLVAQPGTRFSPDRLRELRLRFGCSRSAMASILNVARTTYVGWEGGTSLPPVTLYDQIADQFGEPVLMWLMNRAKEGKDVEPVETWSTHDISTFLPLFCKLSALYQSGGRTFDTERLFIKVELLLQLPEQARRSQLHITEEVTHQILEMSRRVDSNIGPKHDPRPA